MSITNPSAGTFDALNGNELEILRLLANGHTAKSIAARLGRSEAAINERLREARRKTGVTSSRELARLLDAQKIWDKNIDLPNGGHSSDPSVQPPVARGAWTKGRPIMLFAISLAAAGLALAAGTATEQAEPVRSDAAMPAAQSPLVGRWSLDVERVPAEERPQSVTIAFKVSPDRQWTTRVEIVAPDGSRSYADSTAGLDGIPVPVSGNMGFIDTVSLRQPEPNTLVMTLGKNGAPVSTRVYTVAADRRTMTETIVWPGTELPKLESTHFTRVG